MSQVIRINRVCLPENYSRGFYLDLHERYPETFIVSEKDGEIIGYVMCRIESSFSGMSLKRLSLARKGHIISIAVLPEYRKKGVGQAMIKQALQNMFSNCEVQSCYLEVRVSNDTAINLYTKSGFKVDRTLRGYYSDGEDAYIMSRNL